METKFKIQLIELIMLIIMTVSMGIMSYTCFIKQQKNQDKIEKIIENKYIMK